ncbi:peptidoglycan editing factor PgeF [Corynebacterium macginleyi]|uniref:peptidoglycan editing factor PgeF n=1 Tax=Corynebacterium macginleyi TaxID=38290 RepID=UPI000EF976C4|nr:peptidoglycan editing factor PgeF [Corynebacterium macginleyi]MBK4141972.1 peptidoglycan editing factor PgeF [Corynebacterium macginleyi]MBK4148263.1 peptidoglycan editing factor PgeF [Corynebacterium macginleyi]MBK4153303.1 peptidoglycan editing factor PgeF [Corynebacterium macginleyi]MBK4160170.1 peptidoglycan editing factor PgeF [Corynebacterium macginleyi]MBK4161112.1 peptidoglycan editing factor PgeF [Corynebacterium macginleyi]
MSVNEEHRTNRPVRMVFTSRAGGASAYPYESFNLGSHVGDNPANVAANRERLLRITGIENIVWMEQLHTNTVTVVDGPRDTPVPATDAILTTQRRLGLGVLVADCTPVLLVDVSAGVIAAVHAGRLGARNAIVVNTVREMQKLGAQPERIQVVMGPAASGKNYEVPEEMANDVERRLPGSKCKTAQGTWGIDVRAGLIRQLMGLGITNIDSDPRCTIEDTNFFSYRREGTTGRQAGVIWLEANHE